MAKLSQKKVENKNMRQDLVQSLETIARISDALYRQNNINKAPKR